MTTTFPAELIQLLQHCERAAALTGAGISQESGLPTFRDAQEGLWAQYRPEDLATPEAFRRDPKLVWDWYAMRREKAEAAQPNPGHGALERMSRHIPHFTLVTQNVDGLHQKAGSREVIELHGNIRRVKCSRCSRVAETWQDDGQGVPCCAACGGLLRPDVVWFGENLPAGALEAAVEAARGCQVFFSIGTSGLVQPAASLAILALEQGGRVVEISPEPTLLTPRVSFFLQGRSGEILPELVRSAWG
jgi:NAD-dependent deacetylase